MKIPPALQILSLWLLVTIIGTALTMTRADAAETTDPPTAPSSLVAPAEAEATTAETTDGPDVTLASTNQCASGYFCVWTQANYTGTIQRFKTQSQYSSIAVYRVGSFYNNRSKRVFLYADASGDTSACYGAGAKRSSTSGWVTYAEGTYLSTATSC